MGTFFQIIEIAASPNCPFEPLEALVGTGATYTWVPRPILQRLGIIHIERQPFILADGHKVEYEITQVRVRIDGWERFTVCIFGDEDSMPLLGVVTLKEFGLSVDPINKRLVPVPGFLV